MYNTSDKTVLIAFAILAITFIISAFLTLGLLHLLYFVL